LCPDTRDTLFGSNQHTAGRDQAHFGHTISRKSHDREPKAIAMPDNISLIDINALSERISIPKGTLYNLVYLRRIPFVKRGRSLRFDPDEVIQSLAHYSTMGSAGPRWKGR
jgi:hypothetical protein